MDLFTWPCSVWLWNDSRHCNVLTSADWKQLGHTAVTAIWRMGLNYRANPVDIHISACHAFSVTLCLDLSLSLSLFVHFRFGASLMQTAYCMCQQMSNQCISSTWALICWFAGQEHPDIQVKSGLNLVGKWVFETSSLPKITVSTAFKWKHFHF